MKRFLPALINGVITTMLLYTLPACQLRQHESSVNIEGMPFFENMVGMWKMEGTDTYEHWEKAAEGFSITVFKVSGIDTTVLESVGVRKWDTGIVYRVTVAGQNQGNAVNFMLKTVSDSMATFANPAHDFPTEISYSLLRNGNLKAVISGPGGADKKRMEFLYSRE